MSLESFFTVTLAQEPRDIGDADPRPDRHRLAALAGGDERLGAFKPEETGRLRSLARLDILDSAAEKPFENIVDLVRQVFKVPICAISLVDRDRQWFKAHRGLDVCETARDISFCTHAIASTHPFVVEDATLDPRFAANPLVTGAPHIRSYAGIPLTTPEGYNIGTLCAIDTVPRRFTAHDLAIMDSFARVVIGEIDMRQIAAVDALTGLMSRRAWVESVEREISRAQRYQTPLAFLVIDIDRFKPINERFGHAVGDQVINQVAQAVGVQLRQSDFLGRYGGEEFVVALPQTGHDDATALAERLRANIAQLPLECLGDEACTVSIGVTSLGDGELRLSSALDRADGALYQAKRAGRNRVQAIKPDE